MDKIWDRKSFEVRGHWPLWRGWKNRMTTQNRQKSNAKKIYIKKIRGLQKACNLVLGPNDVVVFDYCEISIISNKDCNLFVYVVS